METDISRHHVWSERRDYKTQLERRLRNHRGFIIPTTNDVHKFLHATVEKPPKPTREEIEGCLDFIEQRDSYEHHTKFWAVDAAMQYFVFRGADHPEHEQRCHDIRWNLARQVGIIASEQTHEAEIIEFPINNIVDIWTPRIA